MLRARRFGLSILTLCLTIGLQAQTSASGQKKAAPQAKTPASAQPATPKATYPFDSLTQFSATLSGSLIGNFGQAKIYRAGDMIRVESWNGMNTYFTNIVTKDTYAILRKPKLKTERCLHEAAALIQAFPFTFFRPDHTYKYIPEGEEEVDGHHSHVESVIRTTASGTDMKVKFWKADDLDGFPVKIEVENAGKVHTITYRDVKIGPPDPALFKIPAHCDDGPKR